MDVKMKRWVICNLTYLKLDSRLYINQLSNVMTFIIIKGKLLSLKYDLIDKE